MTNTLAFLTLLAALIATGAHAQIRVPCADSQMQEKVRAVILEGIDQALMNQTAKVFEIWMRDQSNQPKRALTGMDVAVSAYIRSRENAMQWRPPLCPTGSAQQ
jgi:hypothetical protein